MGGPRLGADGVEPDGTRRCWSCDEVVAPHAIACRHCGASLVESDAGARRSADTGTPSDPPSPDARRNFVSSGSHDESDEPHLHTSGGEARRQATDHRSEGRRGSARARRSIDDPVDDLDDQWSDSDFERISQTAGLPREDPRQRRAGRSGRGGSHRRTGRHAGDRLGRVWLDARNLQPHPAVRWLGFAAILVIVGSTIGWVAGRWDAGSWVAQRYAHASSFVQSLTAAPGDGERQATPSRTAPSSADQAAAAISGGAEQAGAPAAGTSESTVVAPRTAVPAPRPEGEDTASLVPIKPSTSADQEAAASAAPPEPAAVTGRKAAAPQPSKPWSVLDVQRELARLGYYDGGLDGQVGPLTRSAVRAFQEDNGMRPTGRIEPTLVSALAGRANDGTAAKASE